MAEANPLRGMQKAYAWGRSQTGRCLRDFVYRGYNADARGRRVFDGVMPHVAGAGRKWLNHRFASPIVSGGQQYEDHFNIADSFPFSYAWSTDHLTGKAGCDPEAARDRSAGVPYADGDGILGAARLAGAHRHAGQRPEAAGHRARLLLVEFATFRRSAAASAPSRGIGQNYSNVVSTSMFFRAMLDAMDRWATDGTPPPAEPHSDPRRWHAGRASTSGGGSFPPFPASHARLPERAAADGFRSRRGARAS